MIATLYQAKESLTTQRIDHFTKYAEETRARDLDREVYQDPDSDRYLIPSERVFENAADDLETIAVSKRSISLLPQKEVVRTDLQPFKQETQPLAQ